ncbi:phage tail tip lysozyme [Fimbriiglobus ruber]|uniref:PE-PGRS virulence associated protein n=1 Tax=Fimbriiglobus ruber TaxID=1908690 RepID=A0A225DL36_9BACT|nr:phage tail tip lysozyme [Fimbriiglobus ruber]OWK42200.1 PE-PGRS virulence associated protein [Fimbriiglobus ruber]
MTIIDTFYLKFVSDAKGAQADVAALDKQISALAAKGKSRNEAEVKELQSLRKQRAEALRDIKDQTDATDKLGDSFVKMVESGAQAATSFLALGAIKAGVLNATQLNSSLEIQGKLIGQNVGALRAYDAAFEAAGGTAGSFLSIYQSAFAQQAAAGLATPAPKEFLAKIRDGLKQYPTQQAKEQYFQRLGLPFDASAKSILESSDAEYAEFEQNGFKNAPLKEDEAKKARDFEKEMAAVQQSLLTAYTKIADDVLPALTGGLQGLVGLLNKISQVPGAPEATAVGGALVGGWGVKKALGWLFGNGAKVGAGETAAGGAGVLSLPGIAAALAAAGVAGGVQDAVTGRRDSYLGRASSAIADRIARSGEKNDNKRRIASLLSKGGLSQDNVNGILANLQTESGFDPRAKGDNGQAFGIAQWHPDRQANFAKLFGHDIRQSTLDEQVQFLLWELQNTHKKAGDALSGADSAQSGAAFSQLFERPANGLAQAQQRALLATRIANETLGAAASSPLNSSSGVSNTTNGGDRSTSVKIDNVNVHTQATDADGMASAAGDALKDHIRYAFSDFDDGRLA